MTMANISLRVSVTEACQLRCRYCRPGEAVPRQAARPRLERADLLFLIEQIHQLAGIEKLRFTGGEPLLRRDLPELIAGCADLGIGDLALTTNAQRLDELAGPLKAAGLQRVNVSLDSLEPETFAAITRGGTLGRSLAGIDAARSAGLCPIKLNMVVIRGQNDHELEAMVDFAIASQCQLRFLELMPIGIAADRFKQEFVPWLEVRDRLSGRFTLIQQPYQAGGTSRNYTAVDCAGRTTTVGFISASSHPFCRGCRRLRITAEGQLLGCLARCRQLDLRSGIAAARAGDPGPLRGALVDGMGMKRQRHDLAEQRDMAHIGG